MFFSIEKKQFGALPLYIGPCLGYYPTSQSFASSQGSSGSKPSIPAIAARSASVSIAFTADSKVAADHWFRNVGVSDIGPWRDHRNNGSHSHKDTKHNFAKKVSKTKHFYAHACAWTFHASAWMFHACAWMFRELTFREKMLNHITKYYEYVVSNIFEFPRTYFSYISELQQLFPEESFVLIWSPPSKIDQPVYATRKQGTSSKPRCDNI